jgi:2-succinyl-6-hydroxy-2,4-cyclohexadiene-1-carboxylate synthase
MLLAIHGLTEDDTVWQSALYPIVPDAKCALLPGHGHRPCLEGTTIATVAKGYAQKYGTGIDVIGYSMGGRIALRLALDFPIRRLVVIGSHPGIRDAKLREQRRAQDERLASMIVEDGIGAFVARWEQHPTLKPHRALPRAVEEQLRSQRLSHDPKGLAAAIRMLGAGTMEPLWDRLPGMQAPTLLIAGEDDDKFKAEMGQMAQVVPNNTYRIITDAGHAVHREQPAAMLDEIKRFLAS